MTRRLAIVMQDPANYGGVLRLAEYIYHRAEAAGLTPTLVHYGRFRDHGELHASVMNLARGELNFTLSSKRYSFRGLRAFAIGAFLPEWEPNRLHANHEWRKALSQEFDAFLLVTGSAQTGLPLAECGKDFTAWVSSTVETDRHARLATGSAEHVVERLGMPSVLRAEKKVLQSAGRVLAVSEDAKQHLAPLAETPVEVWPYPVDTTKFTPTPNHESPAEHRFLFVGRANDPRKRVELFLAACEELAREHPDLDFEGTIVSTELDVRNPPGFTLEHVARAREAELIELFRSSTALLLTSEQEGLGIAAMEAMACGTPVISTRCGGPETLIEDGVSGMFVEPSATKFAGRMYELASNPPIRAALARAASERIATSFSEAVWNPRFENLLRAL